MTVKYGRFFTLVLLGHRDEKKVDKFKDPVFLIGFPRSGTTLLDTILRSHPSIEVLEEIPIINRFIDHLYINKGFTLENLENTDPELIKEMRDYYYNQIESYKKNKDKHINQAKVSKIFKI